MLRKVPAGLPLFLLFLFSLSVPVESGAAEFEYSLIKPLPPYGVYQAMSAQSLRKGAASFGLALEYTKEPDGMKYTLGAAYGLADRVELILNVPYVDDYDGRLTGFEDPGAAVKYRFLEEGYYGPSAAVMAMGFLEAGKEELSRDGGFGLGLLLTKRVGPFMGHLNGIYIWPGAGELEDEWDALGALELAIANNMKVMAEFQLRKGHNSEKIDLSEGRLAWRVFNENLFSTLGFGLDFKDREPEYRLFFTVGTVVQGLRTAGR